MKNKPQKLLTLKQLTEKVHAEIGKSMGIDFNIYTCHHLYKTVKGDGYTIEEIMKSLSSMVDVGTLPPTDSSAQPAYYKKINSILKKEGKKPIKPTH
jgi:hypothetical protein